MTATPEEAARHHLEWVVDALRGATPTEAHIADHLTGAFLQAVPANQVVAVFGSVSDATLAVTSTDESRPGTLVASTSTDLVIELAVEEEPPHRIAELRLRPAGGTTPAGEAVVDPRLADPPFSASGAGDEVVAALRQQFDALGLVGLIAQGYVGGEGDERGDVEPHVASSVVAGWSDLHTGELATPDSRSAAYSVTKLVTAVAVLRLVAAGHLDLDAPVNGALTSYRLSSDDVTIRELLAHTGGVTSDFEHWVHDVPDLATFLGPELEVHEDRRGRHVYSNGGYATLGGVIADVSGRPYDVFVGEEVLRPLGMLASDFPTSAPWPAPGVMSAHHVKEGRVVPGSTRLPSVAAAGGMWTTAGDLARFALGWPSLLPDALVAEALTPHAERDGGAAVGLGFLVGGEGDATFWGHAGGGLGFGSSLLCAPRRRLVAVALVNRDVPAEPLAGLVLSALAAG